MAPEEHLNAASEHEGAKAAVHGAVGLATAVAVTVGTAGLVLTPLGWGILLAGGAIAGHRGWFKKAKDLLS